MLGAMWGIAPGHAAGLVGGMIAGAAWLVLVLALPGRMRGGHRAAPGTVRAAALLMAVSAGVHLGLVPHHAGDPLTALAFLVDAAALAGLAVAALTTRWWRAPAVALLAVTVLAYLVYLVAGLERPDQVGVLAKLTEVLALGLALVPSPGELGRRHHGLRWSAATICVPALVVLTGTTAWIADLVHPGPGHQHVAATFQATNPIPTSAQVAAADRLLADTRAAIAPYHDPALARAAGYRPGPGTERLQHWQNAAFAKGPILDPRRPQALVYVRGRSGPVLAGAMFQMPQRGQIGPDPGGPLTAWHSHDNVCVTPIGFQFSLATPYGTCPLGAISVSVPPMLHVWIVDNPAGGPFAIDLDPRTVRALERT
jgi:hypothetical protein